MARAKSKKSSLMLTCQTIRSTCMYILIVEDEKKVAGFIKQGLQEERYTVDVAYDGE